jgi:hypothetical protein
MKKHKLDDLNAIYQESEEADREIFAEQRSNLLLVAGEHYSKTINRAMTRVREYSKVADTQKLRLTKNHIHKIVRYYENQILSKAPGVTIRPQNESEMQDRKDAELNSAVWNHYKRVAKLKEKIRKWVESFVQIGEVATKIYWDPMKGSLMGYEMRVGPDGQPELDEMGQPQQDESKPIFTGDFVFETLPPFDLLRSKSAPSMDDSPYLVYRKMVEKKTLSAAYANDPAKLKGLEESSKQTFVVFDQNSQEYAKEDKRVLVKEYYFRPCHQYPNGYFYVSTEFAILEEGELPFGIFPIIFKGFDEYPTTPRGRSIVKVARPYQAEINRASSQMATHQITVGDDKIVYQAGTKLAPGALLPGVRGVTYQGAPPQILSGRDGSQFLGYVDHQISEMYSAVMMEEVLAEESQNMDPYALLYRSMKTQLKFAKYGEKFEEFLKDVCFTFLDLAKKYLPDDMFIGAVGRSEAINIEEFRKTTPLAFQISVEEQTDAVDTQLGRQISINHLLQYVGTSLTREDIGKVMKNMPFMNQKELFSDMTIDYECVQNDMLAIERGEQVDVNPYANNEYYVQKFSHRMKQPDFRFLAPEVQEMYAQILQLHEQEVARKVEEEKAAQNEFIPIGGAMIKADMYVTDPKNPMKSSRVELPFQAVDWLIKRLESQGMTQEKLEGMNKQAALDIYGMSQTQQGAANGGAALPGQEFAPGMIPPNMG